MKAVTNVVMIIMVMSWFNMTNYIRNILLLYFRVKRVCVRVIKMLNLASNYSYKFIKDDVSVYMLTKRPSKQYVPSHSMCYYTEPFLSRDNQDIRNAIIGFVDERQCSVWYDKMRKLESGFGRPAVKMSNAEPVESPDHVYGPFMHEPTHMHSIKLSEAKHISDTMRMPLMIVMDENGGNFDVFYYRNKFVETI